MPWTKRCDSASASSGERGRAACSKALRIASFCRVFRSRRVIPEGMRVMESSLGLSCTVVSVANKARSVSVDAVSKNMFRSCEEGFSRSTAPGADHDTNRVRCGHEGERMLLIAVLVCGVRGGEEHGEMLRTSCDFGEPSPRDRRLVLLLAYERPSAASGDSSRRCVSPLPTLLLLTDTPSSSRDPGQCCDQELGAN